MPHPLLVAVPSPCCHGDVGHKCPDHHMGSRTSSWTAENETDSFLPRTLMLPYCEADRLRHLAVEVERLRPLAEELERLLPLAHKVDLLWEHHLQCSPEEPRAPAPPQEEELQQWVPAPSQEPELQQWVVDELARMRLEQAEASCQLSEGRLATSALERAQDQLREALVASTEARAALEEEVLRLVKSVAELSGQSLEFGPPLGRTLNSLDWAALHGQVRLEVEECRREIRQLWLGLGREGVETAASREAQQALASAEVGCEAMPTHKKRPHEEWPTSSSALG